MIKIIGIGNKLMCDDGIASYVLEEIKTDILTINASAEIIIGETDYMYCIETIKDEDLVIIIDSILQGYRPGRVVRIPHSIEATKANCSSHQISLPDLIYQYNQRVKIYMIGIEVHTIDYSYELSDYLKRQFKQICKEVYENINKIIKENHYA